MDRQIPDEYGLNGGQFWLLTTEQGTVVIRNDIWDDPYEGISHAPIWTVGETAPSKYCLSVRKTEAFESVAPADEAWVFDAMKANDTDGPKYLEAVVDGINRQIGKRAYRLINQILADANPSEMSRHILLALARGTFPVRSKLSNWKPFVVATAESFEGRGLDSERLLAGLLDRAPA